MAKAKKDNISDYKDRFTSPMGVKNLVLPKSKNSSSSGAKRKSGTKKK